MSAGHPGLRAVLAKLRRREAVTEDEVQLLKRQIAALEQPARSDHGPSAKTRAVAAAERSGNMLSGHATSEGGERFSARFGHQSVGFYNAAQDIPISSVGIGTYRGACDDETDEAYASAICAALEAGVNLIDTSLNYRKQRSELAVASGVRRFIERLGGDRGGLVICTKGGYLAHGATTAGTLGADDVVGGIHSMAPAFLADQIDRSRRNLGLQTIDVYYLHNPETQLEFVDRATFMNRIRMAFERLERAVADGSIRYYGTATWNGYFDGGLVLPELAEAARQVAGDGHHFRFVQLPFNLGMQAASVGPAEGGRTVLDAAAELGITVIASASLLQGRLAQDLPERLANLLPGLATDGQRAIQFARSTPRISSALVGMSRVEHVAENLLVARLPPLTAAEYARFQSRQVQETS